MNISNIIEKRQVRAFLVQHQETVELERALKKIIGYLRKAMEGKALDWQERDRVDRAVSNLATTQAVLAASLCRHTDTIRKIKEAQSV